ncbi:MAG TPA: hypothetical protein VFR77_10115 [Steroidobacteraceae bacterium]|nr:hypothetical protein [Steroidobacteraceae bacterium]
MKDRNDSIEETENLDQRQSRERARKVEKSRREKPADRKDLDPSPNQRTVQPSNRTRRSG